MPIIHVKRGCNSEILKDWKDLPIKKNENKRFFFGDKVY